MNVISFTENHDTMGKGLYISRKDKVGGEIIGGEIITTFDVRMVLPNREPAMETGAIHTLEHLMAVYLRSPKSGISDEVIYVGPMGCRTGFYIIMKGDLESRDILSIMKAMFTYIQDFEGDIPGAGTSRECGNYLDHDLAGAKSEAEKYMAVLNNIGPENLVYPK